MKNTELMGGDWIKTPNGYEKIRCIYDDAVLTADGEYEGQEYSLDEIEGIPLTSEILEKNGWDVTDSPTTQEKPIGKIKVKRQGDYDYEIQYRIGHYFRLDAFLRKELMNPNKVYTFFPPVTIIIDHNWGVHELQHALRLLGFGDVADNFTLNK